MLCESLEINLKKKVEKTSFFDRFRVDKSFSCFYSLLCLKKKESGQKTVVFDQPTSWKQEFIFFEKD